LWLTRYKNLHIQLVCSFEGGRDYQQAIRYSILAAENAAGRFAYRDSIEILRHALELVARLTPSLQANYRSRFLG
jgi:hypothetical protein